MKSDHQNINADSGYTEYYTPIHIVNAAKRVMGGIDLDPASSTEANERIKTLWFFDRFNDGLKQEWRGRVWMNHPFEKYRNHLWINKLISEYESGNVTEACCITYASTSEAWFRPLMKFPQCFIHGRTNYFLPDGTEKKGVTKGSVVTYLGENPHIFAREFLSLGTIKIISPETITSKVRQYDEKFSKYFTGRCGG